MDVVTSVWCSMAFLFFVSGALFSAGLLLWFRQLGQDVAPLPAATGRGAARPVGFGAGAEPPPFRGQGHALRPVGDARLTLAVAVLHQIAGGDDPVAAKVALHAIARLKEDTASDSARLRFAVARLELLSLGQERWAAATARRGLMAAKSGVLM